MTDPDYSITGSDNKHWRTERETVQSILFYEIRSITFPLEVQNSLNDSYSYSSPLWVSESSLKDISSSVLEYSSELA